MCSSKANHQPSLSNSLIITISNFQIMKKSYIIPSQIVCELHANNVMAVSLVDGNADPDAEVLTKENTDWDFWDDGDGYSTPKNPKFFD